MTAYDVAIVGAGPAGSATAIYLARAGWRVALLDRAVFPRDKPCAEYLSPAAEPLLAKLGALEEIAAGQPARLRGFRIFSPNGSVFQGDFAATRDAEGHSAFETGLAVPRLNLDAALVSAARRAGAEVREGWRLADLSREGGEYTLTPVLDGEPLRTRLLVAADGVHSTVARRLGLHAPTRMRKIALVAHIRGIDGLGEYGEMHVAGRGYVGLAPLDPAEVDVAERRCNVAMVVDEARDGRHLAGRPQEFLLETLESFPRLAGRLAQATVARKTLSTSRICVRARRVYDDGLLLVGDASGYYDPFTGEGIYRALRGAEIVSEVANAALASGDVGAGALARYGALHRAEFRGKRTIEWIIQSAVQVPPLMDHIAGVLGRRKGMADTIVAVTGDFLPPSAVLRPGYLLRLVI